MLDTDVCDEMLRHFGRLSSVSFLDLHHTRWLFAHVGRGIVELATGLPCGLMFLEIRVFDMFPISRL